MILHCFACVRYCGLTARVSCGGWERGLALETEKAQSHENAQKTRGLPTVSCTLCWALLLIRVHRLRLVYAIRTLPHYLFFHSARLYTAELHSEAVLG